MSVIIEKDIKMLYVVGENLMAQIQADKQESFMLAIGIELKAAFNVSVQVEPGAEEIKGFHFIDEQSPEFVERIPVLKQRILDLRDQWRA